MKIHKEIKKGLRNFLNKYKSFLFYHEINYCAFNSIIVSYQSNFVNWKDSLTMNSDKHRVELRTTLLLISIWYLDDGSIKYTTVGCPVLVRHLLTSMPYRHSQKHTIPLVGDILHALKWVASMHRKNLY